MRMLSPISTEWSWPRRSFASDRMGDVFEDFNQIVDSFLRPTYTAAAHFQPSCDVSETKDDYLVSFDMPGVKKEDVKIEVQGNQLVISGRREQEFKKENDESTIHRERSYGQFQRTFSLPNTIAADKIEAQYENGVLNVALPKAEAAKARTIQIQSGQGGLLSKLMGSKKESNKELKDAKVS